ncbi:hypothetical protein CALVIDRAFT_128084 [Calocera viscosa TUFC12733]|uniref:Uncharacterized protein n=1 Tax=Calocera viscosa (strain TUFC12733) TaxID=1330018 RepID=A0A167RST9_CALVF|nr:hypothetical protein CALVIDRAFT_128084 [Calocera viscosa TUFC12733]
MPTLLRSAKSASEWTEYDLRAFNIEVKNVDACAFFGVHFDSITLDDLDEGIFHGNARDDIQRSDQATQYLRYLDWAFNAALGQESAIRDFAQEMLKLCRYNERDVLLRSQYTIPFTICGEQTTTQTDVTLVHFNGIILLITEEDGAGVSHRDRDPEAQVIAKAVATFQHNNLVRRDFSKIPLDAMTIPCITMVGTLPTFYLVPVTSTLNKAVISGEACANETVVQRCSVPFAHFLSAGMEVPEYRRTAFQYFKAFKGLAKSHWNSFADLME